MTTTNEQKAGILARWRDHRLGRKLEADVAAQLKFNWPSLARDDAKEVLKMVAKRKPANEDRKMYEVEIEKGGKSIGFRYKSKAVAAALVEYCVGGGKWKSETEMAKGDVIARSAQLEEIMEADAGELGDDDKEQIDKWLKAKKGNGKAVAENKPARF